ncbi:SPOR domain-containing protein [Marinifilum sp. RC60d5]|uniref:HU domain-containing protein n=1 Tax=Marinifilum sp. RC60d5 TaxID=3458414 RepID=UPI0040370C15
MLEVSKYIEDLLFVHDCVILPGFGGFVANYKSAKFDDNQQLVLPPSKDIGFNRNLIQNDGLLINHLADSENLNYTEAEKSILFFVEDIKVKIQRGEKVELNNIGVFFNDRRHNLQFEPSNNMNYLVDAFGLEQLSFTELSKPVEERIHNIGANSVKVKSFFTRKRIWYTAAAACISVVIFLPLNTDRSSFLNSASMGFSDSKAAISENHVQLKAQISPPEELVKYEPKLENKSAGVSVQKVSSNMYYLIAGSFTTTDNAKILQKELISKSYPAIIIRNKNLYSVAINKFNSRTAVDKFKKKVIAANPKSSYWVLKK